MLVQYLGITLAKILEACTAIAPPSRGLMTLKEFADDYQGFFRDNQEKETLFRDVAEVKSYFSQAAFKLGYVNDDYYDFPNHIRSAFISFDYPGIYADSVMSVITETINVSQKGHIVMFVTLDLINGDGLKRIRSEETLRKLLGNFYVYLCKRFPFDLNDKDRFINFSSNLIYGMSLKMKDLSPKLERVHGLSDKNRKTIDKNSKKWKRTSKGKKCKTTAWKGKCTPTGNVERSVFKRKFKKIGRRTSSRNLGKSRMNAHNRKYYESPSVEDISSLEPSFSSKVVSESSDRQRRRHRRHYRSHRTRSYSGGIGHSFSTMVNGGGIGIKVTKPVPVKMGPIKDFYNKRDPNLKPPSNL